MTLNPPPPGLEECLAAELLAMPIPYLSVLGALREGPCRRSVLQRIIDEDIGKVLDWLRQRGLLKPGVDLTANDSTFALTNLAGKVLTHVFRPNAAFPLAAAGAAMNHLQVAILRVLHRASDGLQYPALRFAVGASHAEFRHAVNALMAGVLVHRHLIPQETGVLASILRLSPRGMLVANKLLSNGSG